MVCIVHHSPYWYPALCRNGVVAVKQLRHIGFRPFQATTAGLCVTNLTHGRSSNRQLAILQDFVQALKDHWEMEETIH